jgi:hypothetical protein
VLAHRGGDHGGACDALIAVRPAIRRLGGSHAQRDLFVRTLALLAAEQGDPNGCARVMVWRGRLKRQDRFAAAVQERLAAALARTGRAA